MDTDLCYMGRQWCGHIVAVTIDNPAHFAHTGKVLAQWGRSGLTIERSTITEARKALEFCDCQKERAKAARQAKLLKGK